MTFKDADRILDLRERIVFAIDELAQDDVGSASFHLTGLLADLDAAVAETGGETGADPFVGEWS